MNFLDKILHRGNKRAREEDVVETPTAQPTEAPEPAEPSKKPKPSDPTVVPSRLPKMKPKRKFKKPSKPTTTTPDEEYKEIRSKISNIFTKSTVKTLFETDDFTLHVEHQGKKTIVYVLGVSACNLDRLQSFLKSHYGYIGSVTVIGAEESEESGGLITKYPRAVIEFFVGDSIQDMSGPESSNSSSSSSALTLTSTATATATATTQPSSLSIWSLRATMPGFVHPAFCLNPPIYHCIVEPPLPDMPVKGYFRGKRKGFVSCLVDHNTGFVIDAIIEQHSASRSFEFPLPDIVVRIGKDPYLIQSGDDESKDPTKETKASVLVGEQTSRQPIPTSLSIISHERFITRDISHAAAQREKPPRDIDVKLDTEDEIYIKKIIRVLYNSGGVKRGALPELSLSAVVCGLSDLDVTETSLYTKPANALTLKVMNISSVNTATYQLIASLRSMFLVNIRFVAEAHTLFIEWVPASGTCTHNWDFISPNISLEPPNINSAVAWASRTNQRVFAPEVELDHLVCLPVVDDTESQQTQHDSEVHLPAAKTASVRPTSQPEAAKTKNKPRQPPSRLKIYSAK